MYKYNLNANTIYAKGVLIMKATGIVRRLDDLGRLVIPKEIRKQYRLKEGDSIEFYIDDDKIVIQKHDILSKHIEEVNIMCDTLTAMFQNRVLFIQDEWLNSRNYKLNDSFLAKTHIHRVTTFNQEKVFENDLQYYNGIVYPIIVYGDWYGAFVILYDKKVLNKEELYAVEAYTQLLTRQQQQ